MIATTHVLLSIEQPMYAASMRATLQAHDDVHIVGETSDVVESLALLKKHRPDLWVHSWPAGRDLHAILSHAYSVHPDVRVLSVDPAEPAGILQMQVHSVDSVLRLTGRTREMAEAYSC